MSRDLTYLQDIVESAILARTYLEGMTFEQFRADLEKQDSAIRRIEIIGEASRRLSPQMKAKHPDVPWAKIVGMRNRMIHEYDRLILDVIWEAVQSDLPRLIDRLQAILDDNPPV